MKGHPTESELALLASGDCGPLSRRFLSRHVRDCSECTAEVARFETLRAQAAEAPAPEMDWSRIAAEMRANINLGLEAGECVRTRGTVARVFWNPRVGVAFASLALLVSAGFLMKSPAPHPVRPSAPVLESSGSGLELREGSSSLTILNHHGAIASQTVSAQGEIGARYIDGDTGAVTINNVYLE